MKLRETMRKKAYETGAVLVCMAVLCFFVSLKQGYHMDELLSFELANAEFNPWIVTTQPEGRLAKFVHNEIDGETLGETFQNLVSVVKDVIENRGNSRLLSYKADVYEEPVWITSKQFQDYITVDGGDAFNYLSVYFNVKDDNHPPLHFMLLHTVSSLFQGKISPWMGCVINLAALLVIMILLPGICRRLAPELGLAGESRIMGIMAVLLYGLSAGAVATALLIRMYGMVTLWCVLYFYLILIKWQENSFDRHNSRLILVTVLGFWTQYFFLFYCIFLAAAVLACLWKNRRVRQLLCFVRSMVIAAAAGLLTFPFAIQDVFSSERGVEALGNLSQGLAGYGERLIAFAQILIGRSIGRYGLILLILLGALVLAGRLQRGAAGKRLTAKETRERPEAEREDRDKGAQILWMLLFPMAGYFFMAARMSPYLVDRYIMPLFPFAALTTAAAVFVLLRALEKNFRKEARRGLMPAVCVMLVLFQIYGLWRYDGSYLYQGYELQEAVTREYSRLPCICVYEGVGYYENLIEFTYYDKSLLVTYEELKNRKDRQSIEELDRVAVLIKREADPLKVLELLTDSYGFEVEGMGWRAQGVHGDELFILRKDV